MYYLISARKVHSRGARTWTYLDAVVTVGEVVHGLELLVDNADARLVGAVDDLLDVGGGLAKGRNLLVEALSGLDGGLGVELGCSKLVIDRSRRGIQSNSPG